MEASDASYSNYKELGVRRRRSGLLHVEFQRRWNLRTIYELMRVLDMAGADTGVQVIVLSGELAVGPHDPFRCSRAR